MELISHISIEHNEEDEILNMILHSTPKSNNEKQNYSFVFNEQLLNELVYVGAKKRAKHRIGKQTGGKDL